MWIAEDDEKEENTDIGTSWEMYFKDRSKMIFFKEYWTNFFNFSLLERPGWLPGVSNFDKSYFV